MKRIFLGVITVLLAVFGMSTGVQAANTDNFTITNYDVQMELGRDSERRSTLKTTLTITADFPPNQNRGIAPIFVKDYDGHHTSFNLVSVTDETGAPLEYTWNEDELRIGNKNVYVEGKKTYVITYTQRDVTKYYADTTKDEFYWDAIGVEWRVPIEQASVSLALSDEVKAQQQTDMFCYMGWRGSRHRCSVAGMTATARDLSTRQGVTIAVGFNVGTFAPYQMTLAEQLMSWWVNLLQATTAIALGLAIMLSRAYSRSVGRDAELKPIVPEYLPPKDTSLTTSAMLLSSLTLVQSSREVKGSVMAAQLIDLAVRHIVKIYEVKKKTLFRPAEYEIEVVLDLDNLKSEERELLSDMFGRLPKAGERLNLKELQNNTAYLTRTLDNDSKLTNAMEDEYGLKVADEAHRRRFQRYTRWLVLLGVLTLSPIILVLAGLMCWPMVNGKRLTDKGLNLRRYLLGLKMYIGVAEEERLRMLQSPEGAKKVAEAGFNGADDQKKLVELYERVLPYAVLFGQEKEWSEQIGVYYEQSGGQPDWYSGSDIGFYAVMFASGMSSLSSAASSASSASSLSGGSSGGGSTGGGGGGGGGGGW